jgi:hypothetical protein
MDSIIYLCLPSTEYIACDRSLFKKFERRDETKKASSPFAILASMEIKENGVRSAKEDKP